MKPSVRMLRQAEAYGSEIIRLRKATADREVSDAVQIESLSPGCYPVLEIL